VIFATARFKQNCLDVYGSQNQRKNTGRSLGWISQALSLVFLVGWLRNSQTTRTWTKQTLNLILFMLETIAIILILLWLLGLVSSYTMGGFIHILLVIAVIVIIVRLIQGRRV
jgi:hypothetical protein